ncbi:MAG: HNH endonuclease [Rhodospirillales bacterium]|nr:HNH endonuclease [Rhodospirillales bacterium]
MWHWDQGRLAYFQFDSLSVISRYVIAHDFKQADRPGLRLATGLPFQAPATHSPWRNYSRVVKLALLVSERDGIAEPTPVAALLAQPGAVTSDEYLHFLAQVSSEPNPALAGWSNKSALRFPMLFCLKYLLAKSAIGTSDATPIDELVGAYRTSGLDGSEGQLEFASLIADSQQNAADGATSPESLRRQARESIRVLCQISYLFLSPVGVSITLAGQDAADIFDDLSPVGEPREADGDAEIRRLARLFGQGSVHDFFGFPNTVVSDVAESGFLEGTKVQKTHVTIERNSGLRKAYFAEHPTTVCDVCDMDTRKTYPWTDRVMDLHHLLPLASGTRVAASGTTFDDLVPICPSCHRAVHRFYGDFFRNSQQRDFTSRDEAVLVYEDVKRTFQGIIRA